MLFCSARGTHLAEVGEEAVVDVAEHVLDAVKADAVVGSGLSGHDAAVDVGGVGGILDGDAGLGAKHGLERDYGKQSKGLSDMCRQIGAFAGETCLSQGP